MLHDYAVFGTIVGGGFGSYFLSLDGKDSDICYPVRAEYLHADFGEVNEGDPVLAVLEAYPGEEGVIEGVHCAYTLNKKVEGIPLVAGDNENSAYDINGNKYFLSGEQKGMMLNVMYGVLNVPVIATYRKIKCPIVLDREAPLTRVNYSKDQFWKCMPVLLSIKGENDISDFNIARRVLQLLFRDDTVI